MLDDLCACGHPWLVHARRMNGAYGCRIFGCGCLDVVPPEEESADRYREDDAVRREGEREARPTRSAPRSSNLKGWKP